MLKIKQGDIVTTEESNSYRVLAVEDNKLKVVQYCEDDNILFPRIDYISVNDVVEVF